MPEDFIRSSEFERSIKGIQQDIQAARAETAAGLGEIRRCLDDIQCSINDQAVVMADRTARLATVERAIDRKILDTSIRRTDPVPPELSTLITQLQGAMSEDNKPALTKRDIKVLGAVIVAIQTVIGFGVWVWMKAKGIQ